jgi:hypothetical protein
MLRRLNPFTCADDLASQYFHLAAKASGHGTKIIQALLHLVFRQSHKRAIVRDTNLI